MQMLAAATIPSGISLFTAHTLSTPVHRLAKADLLIAGQTCNKVAVWMHGIQMYTSTDVDAFSTMHRGACLPLMKRTSLLQEQNMNYPWYVTVIHTFLLNFGDAGCVERFSQSTLSGIF
eukprot:2804906-Rhodomonas_salina.6